MSRLSEPACLQRWPMLQRQQWRRLRRPQQQLVAA
jgi:hypothetical protein